MLLLIVMSLIEEIKTLCWLCFRYESTVTAIATDYNDKAEVKEEEEEEEEEKEKRRISRLILFLVEFISKILQFQSN